jgi:DNA-binding PadR family transcriptional regulator
MHRQATMSPQVFHILLALSDGERHGYGVILEVARQTRDRVRLGTGTLYTAIGRLVDAGWIEESDARPDPDVDDERRRYYRLTAAGRAALRDESERLAEAVAAARRKRVLGRQAAGSRRGGS